MKISNLYRYESDRYLSHELRGFYDREEIASSRDHKNPGARTIIVDYFRAGFIFPILTQHWSHSPLISAVEAGQGWMLSSEARPDRPDLYGHAGVLHRAPPRADGDLHGPRGMVPRIRDHLLWYTDGDIHVW